MLLDLIQKNKNFDEIYKHLNKDGQIVHGLTNSSKSLILANLCIRSNRPIIFVVQNHHDAQIYHREISNLCKNQSVFNFQCQEVSPYDQINSDASVLSSEYEVFEHWKSNRPSLTVMTIKALAQKYINSKLLEDEKITINKNYEIEPATLAKRLSLMGYDHVAMVDNRGQFSHRGDIFDIYPMLGDPVRIEFFGDSIENVRTFSVSTQRSIKKIEDLIVHPRFAIIRKDQDGLEDRIRQLAETQGVTSLLDSSSVNEDASAFVQEGKLFWEGIEYYRELLGQEGSSIFEFIPKQTQIILDEWQDITHLSLDWQKKQEELYQDGIKQHKLLALNSKLHLEHTQIRDSINNFSSRIYVQTMIEPMLEQGSSENTLSYGITTYPTERFASKVEEFITYIRKEIREGQTVVIFSEQPQRVTGILKEWDILSVYHSYNPDDPSHQLLNLEGIEPGKVIIQRDGLEEGCKLPDLKLTILTDRELFGRSRQAVARQKNTNPSTKSNKQIYTDIAELKPGDYVVHYKHGVGLYKGTEFIELDQGRLRQEYLALEYADEARILLPVDQVNLLSRFNVNQEVKPKLSKLGGTDWDRTKKKVKKSVRRIAQDLINLYALRSKQKGYIYPPDTPWQIEVEDAFPYNETEDQLKAIEAIKHDMETDKLMDRLICGDAGYGKTEVIIRTVFKVIMEGKQVAILVPTTVLAQQHFNVFSDRYAPYPIRIGLLSRFRTAKEQREVVQKAKLGEVDLVIGTHRLLQKDVQFKNLSLLVIDEEQRFGVSHKERLKEFRRDLDVISMSATPIPRTLHMSLSGIRDISLISTPPTNRKPVKTFVGEYKNSLIRNAILHELERGGKVFFVHNRVENIESMAYIVQELVPEAKVRIGHGQMNDRELEDVMFSFVNDEFNVLVCTTIVETGLDIASANTIIINDANRFGLSQLYQLRGRVGRSDVQAYAYLLYKPDGEMSDTARERLKAIRELTKLGSGYQIAMRDMEIRGVGNVFGAEQHGQMLSVGFDLYCKLLSDTIEEMKGNISEEEIERNTIIDIKINSYFPENWISDKKQRMNEYKRLSVCKDQNELDALINEWQDRFGKLPYEALNLVELCRIKILAAKAGILSINQEGDTIRIVNNLRLQTWLPLQRKLSAFLQPRINFKAGAVGARSSNSTLSLKISGMDHDTIVQTVREIVVLIKDALS